MMTMRQNRLKRFVFEVLFDNKNNNGCCFRTTLLCIGLTDTVVGYITAAADQGMEDLPGYGMPVDDRCHKKPE